MRVELVTWPAWNLSVCHIGSFFHKKPMFIRTILQKRRQRMDFNLYYVRRWDHIIYPLYIATCISFFECSLQVWFGTESVCETSSLWMMEVCCHANHEKRTKQNKTIHYRFYLDFNSIGIQHFGLKLFLCVDTKIKKRNSEQHWSSRQCNKNTIV